MQTQNRASGSPLPFQRVGQEIQGKKTSTEGTIDLPKNKSKALKEDGKVWCLFEKEIEKNEVILL